MCKTNALALLMLLGLGLLTGLALVLHQPPPLLSADAPAATFSGMRALQHVNAIARLPRPVGSPALADVRTYLLRELEALDLSPQVQVTTAQRGSHLASVHNVLVRIAGTANTRAVLLVAHYDSVATSPGAADNGSGVAALLETLRALRAGAPLQNDVLVLFTSPEETGRHGALAFLAEHPWAKDVGLVLNFDVAGNAGPAYLTGMSSGNAWLMREFARAAPDPFAGSIVDAIQRIGTGSTSDWREFTEAGLPAFEFGFFEGKAHYDSPLDNLQYLDPRSLQHQGEYALALTHHFGNVALPGPAAGDAVYFDLLGRVVLVYPAHWSLPLALLLGLLLAAVIWLGLRRTQLTVAGIVLGLLAFLASFVGGPLLVWLAWWLITHTHPVYAAPLHGRAYNDLLFMLGFVGLTMAVTTAFFELARHRIGAANLVAGALAGISIGMLASSILLPGASYLFTWPLCFGLAAMAVFMPTSHRQASTVSPSVALFLLVGAAPTIVVLVPTFYAAFMGVRTADSPFTMSIVVLLLASLLPQLQLTAPLSRRSMPVGAVLVALGSLGAALVWGRFDAQRPQTTGLFYAMNADTGNAAWITEDRAASRRSPWEAQFFRTGVERRAIPEFLPGAPFQYIVGDAPPISVNTPSLRILHDAREGDTRTIRVHIGSPRQAKRMTIFTAPTTHVLAAAVDGRRIEEPHALGLALVYDGFPAAGIELLLTVRAVDPITITLVDQSYGLPEASHLRHSPLPAHVIAYGPAASTTMVRKSYTL
jgi:hypothetical protein